METRTHLLHQARINNNCPECYATDGLEFTFTQEEKENKFYSKASKQIKEQLYCHHCKQDIYPVKWTEDIERVYEYHKKRAEPKNTSVKLKPLLYGMILFDVVVIAIIIYYLNNR